MARRITHLVLHCSGSDKSTVESMTRFHRLVNKWRTIGYHKIVYADASLHRGRPDRQPGAGVLGFNAHTLHLCMVGDLDKHPPTTPQYSRAVAEFASWCSLYGLDPLSDILGHRETKSFVKPWQATKKTCPGKTVDMDLFRFHVHNALHGVPRA